MNFILVARSSVHRIESTTQELNGNLAAAISHLVEHIEASRSMQVALHGLLGPMRQSGLGSDPEASTNLLEEQAICRTRMVHQDNLYVRATRTVKTCRLDCPCICHIYTYASIPQSLKRFLGWGRIETRSGSKSTSPCNDKACAGNFAQHVQIQYMMPTWLAMRMISMSFTSSPSHGPQLLFQFPRLLGKENRGLRAVKDGDLDLLKLAIGSGECRPFDIDEDGESLLEVRPARRIFVWQIISSSIWYQIATHHLDILAFLANVGGEATLSNILMDP